MVLLKEYDRNIQNFYRIACILASKFPFSPIKMTFRHSVYHTATARRRRVSHHILPDSLGI